MNQNGKDAMIMAMRLMGEPWHTMSPEVQEVLVRWKPMVQEGMQRVADGGNLWPDRWAIGDMMSPQTGRYLSLPSDTLTSILTVDPELKYPCQNRDSYYVYRLDGDAGPVPKYVWSVEKSRWVTT